MKTVLIFVSVFLFTTSHALACTVCKKNQPEILQEITHGTGPESRWDYVIVIVMIAVVVGTLMMSIRYLVKPGEQTRSHIKHSILDPESI